MAHYHVGYNDAGCSPNPDVIVCVESAEDARDALVAKVDELAEYLEMACGHANFVATCSLCGHWRAALDKARELVTVDVSAGYDVSLGDGRSLPVVHWVAVVPDRDCDQDQD